MSENFKPPSHRAGVPSRFDISKIQRRQKFAQQNFSGVKNFLSDKIFVRLMFDGGHRNVRLKRWP